MGNTEKTEKIVILASLLHDIGKFIGRSEGQRGVTHQKLGEELLGALAFEEPKSSIFKSVARIIGAHHDPDSLEDKQERKIAYIIQLTDWLSSSERIQSEGGIDAPRWEQNLVSVFEEISLSGNERNVEYQSTSKFPLKKLSFDKDTIFPSKEPTSAGYTEMYDEFRQELLLFLHSYDLESSVEPLLSILEKYFWSTPSATYWKRGSSLPDVSLYDHSRITSAIALSLYRGVLYDKSEEYIKEILNALKEKRENVSIPLFTMIHGDFSGIQNFITNISSKLAAKSLKGRSTGLVIMQRLIMEHFLKGLNLDLPNALYSGGGHFYIIASYSSSKEEIRNIQNETNKALYDHFGLDLYLSIGTVDVCLKHFYSNDGITCVWRSLSESVSEDKKMKFKNLGYELFNPKGVGGLVLTCDICGKEISPGSYKEVERYKICNDCYGFVKLAEYLRNAFNEGYVEISELKEKLPFAKHFDTLTKDKFALDFLRNFNEKANKFYPVFTLPLGFPLSNGQIKELDKLAEDSEDETGTRKIGIFKADVDNLGKIFMRGLGQGEKSLSSLSRISTLSRLFSIFFEGYINTLIKEKYEDSIYLIYSGGDDILAIGSWDKIIDFAKNLYEDFKKFVCNNDNITMSASIVVASPHSSVRTLLRGAEEKLEAAKELETEIDGKVVKKSAINIFGEMLYWDGKENSNKSEFGRALSISDEVKGLLPQEKGGEGASRGLVIEKTKVLATYAYNKLKDGELDGELLSVLWLLRYFWYRNILSKDKENKNEKAEKALEEINSILEQEIFRKKSDKPIPKLKDLIVGLRLAELTTRNKNEDKMEVKGG
jgi:CRISPR-associated protein Csm1